MKLRSRISTVAVSALGFAFAAPALAAEDVTSKINAGLKAAAQGYGPGTPADLTVVIGNLISVVLTILGAVLLLYLIYGGFLWMTAQGDETKVKNARNLLKNAIIGMVIVAASYSIAQYVINRLAFVTTGTSPQEAAPKQ